MKSKDDLHIQSLYDEISSLKAKYKTKSEALLKAQKEIEKNREKMDLYFNNSDLSFLILNTHQIITDVNDIFCELFQFDKEEIIGEPFSKIFTTTILYDTWRKNYLNFYEFESISNLEYRLQKKKKHIFWAEMFGKKFDYNGKEYSLWSIRDISLRVRSRNTIRNLNTKLLKQFEELKEVLDIMPLPIFIKDKNFRYLSCNKAFLNFFQIESHDILGKNVFDLFDEQTANFYDKQDQEGKLLSYQVYRTQYLKDEGKNLILEIHKKRLIKDDEFNGFVGLILDMTEQEEQEKILQERIEKEVAKNLFIQQAHQEEMIRNAKFTSIGQMAAGITHEINTPLTYVKGNFEMLIEDLKSTPQFQMKSEMLEDADIIFEGLERIKNIIETMREASQKSIEKRDTVNLYETLMSSLLLSHNRAKQVVNIKVDGEFFKTESDIKQKKIFLTEVQKQRVEQVWIVIINNALDELIKINDFSARQLNIEIQEIDEDIVVNFSDNAGGINEEILPKIFEPFESTKESSGIGIGLNIAHKIVTQNDGSIRAYNADKGAVFEVKFPKYKGEKNEL